MLTQEQQIFEQIKKADNILVTFKSAWSGDAVASSLALFLFLKKLGKNVEIAAEKLDSDKLYSFLPGYSEIKYERKENKLNFIISPKNGWFTEDDITTDTSGFKYGLIIAVGTPDLESLGRIYDNDTEFFYQTPLINLDHNSTNEGFGQINFIELTAVATAEIIFSLLDSYSRDLIDENIATCLLAGMIAETKSFKTNNVTPRALLIASQLMTLGGRREEIVNHLYRSKSLNVLKLWGRVLARLRSSLENKLVWSTITTADFQKTASSEKDLIDVIDELIISLPQAKITAIIYESETSANPEQPNKTSSLLLYAIKNIDAMSLLKEFNPAGTKSLAKAIINAPIEQAEKIVIAAL